MDQPRHESEQGVALLEFALLATLLLLFLSVSIDFARAFVQHTAISRIAFETARYAAALPQPVNSTCGPGLITDPCTGAWAESVRRRMLTLAVQYVAAHPEFTLSDPEISSQIACDTTAKTISISLTFPFTPITPGFNFLTRTGETVVGPSLFF